jgi:hypothetical protein
VTSSNGRLQGGELSDPNQSKPDQSKDVALVSFLKANAPSVPEPRLDLEDQLMHAISKDVSSRLPRQHQLRPRPKSRWNGAVAAFIGLGAGAIAIGLGQLHEWFASPALSSNELAQLESFMVNDWDEAVLPIETAPKDWNWLDAKLSPASSTVDSVRRLDSSFSNHSSNHSQS